MIDKSRLFSIGKLSKLTGVHIQSLRYYEKIGILRPAFVDPNSRYRYYTFQHMKIVEAIQYCSELDIPLKQFRNFLLEEDEQIDYSKLIEYGIHLTNKKMERIQKRLTFLEDVQKELTHAAECKEGILTKGSFPERLCWAIPYEGIQSDSNFHTAVYHLIADVESHGLRAGYNTGQLLLWKGQEVKSYLFIDIRESGSPLSDFPQIIRIPGGEYLCSISTESNIKKAPHIFPSLFEQDYEKVVIEVELFSKRYRYTDPIFEIRCNLP